MIILAPRAYISVTNTTTTVALTYSLEGERTRFLYIFPRSRTLLFSAAISYIRTTHTHLCMPQKTTNQKWGEREKI